MLKKSANGTIIFPVFQNENNTIHGHYKHLKQLYELEKTSLVNYGHLLKQM